MTPGPLSSLANGMFASRLVSTASCSEVPAHQVLRQYAVETRSRGGQNTTRRFRKINHVRSSRLARNSLTTRSRRFETILRRFEASRPSLERVSAVSGLLYSHLLYPENRLWGVSCTSVPLSPTLALPSVVQLTRLTGGKQYYNQ